MATYEGRFQFLTDTSSGWALADPVLKLGEFGVADPGSSIPILKCGDNVRPFSALPAITGGSGGGGSADYVVGTTTTLPPGTPATVVINNGVDPPTISFGIPQGIGGPEGDPGPANSLAIGTVTTGAPGSAAAAAITGTPPAQVLNLTIPQGAQGDPGPANFANPTGTIGLAAVNGVSVNAMRADAAPPLSLAIVPTWTGPHTFTAPLTLRESAAPALAAADEYSLTAQDDSGVTRLYVRNSRAAWVVNQDNYVVSRNTSGATIPKFRAVRATGGSANRPTIGLADPALGPAGGVTGASAANNAFVEVVTLGVLTNVDTSAWVAGTRLYLGAGGILTNVPPAFPGALQLMGVVLDQHAVNGSVYISRTSDVRAGLTSGDAAANPSATIGLAAVNGVALTLMRSDAAPALSVAIAPAWTGQHSWALPLLAASGTAALPSYSFSAQTNMGLYLAALNDMRLTAGGDRLQIVSGSGMPVRVLTGQLGIDNGTAVAPAIAYVSDPGTGMFRVAAGMIGFSLAGTTYFDLHSTRANFTTRILTVNGTAASPSYSFADDSGNGMFFIGSDNLGFSTNGVLALQIDGSGRLFPANRIYAPDGTVPTPAYSFVAEASSGLMRVTAGTLDIVALGVNSARFTGGAVQSASFITASARSIKRETGAPQYAANILARLRPVLYRLIEGDDREQIGLIAEEVHEVCPQLSDGKTVAYDRLALLLLAEWQARAA